MLLPYALTGECVAELHLGHFDRRTEPGRADRRHRVVDARPALLLRRTSAGRVAWRRAGRRGPDRHRSPRRTRARRRHRAHHGQPVGGRPLQRTRPVRRGARGRPRRRGARRAGGVRMGCRRVDRGGRAHRAARCRSVRVVGADGTDPDLRVPTGRSVSRHARVPFSPTVSRPSGSTRKPSTGWHVHGSASILPARSLSTGSGSGGRAGGSTRGSS